MGPHLHEPGGANVPASHFLRPSAGRLAGLHPRHLGVIEAAMTRAARQGLAFHLWWHPHNFGLRTAENLSGLDRLLAHFHRLQGDYGMVSRGMLGSGEAVP